jgi:hypothetical protein
MKVVECSLEGQFLKTHKDMDSFTNKDIDGIIQCLNNKKLSYNDKIWIEASTPISLLIKKVLLIKNIKEKDNIMTYSHD